VIISKSGGGVFENGAAVEASVFAMAICMPDISASSGEMAETEGFDFLPLVEWLALMIRGRSSCQLSITKSIVGGADGERVLRHQNR
jgi:hypothetical protein